MRKIIEKAKSHNWKTCIYGLGNMGRAIKGFLFEAFNLKTDYYSDIINAKVDQFSLDGAVGIYKSELMNILDDILIFVLVDQPMGELLAKELNESPQIHAYPLKEICKCEEVLRLFYGDEFFVKYCRLPNGEIENNKITDEYRSNVASREKLAIYTCITGGYDSYDPPIVQDDYCNYFIISDQVPSDCGIGTYIDVDQVVPDVTMTPKDKNRYCKMHSKEIFPSYRYSIYLDGQIKIQKSLAHYIEYLGRAGLAIHKPRSFDCLYIEGMLITWNGRARKEDVLDLMNQYVNEGMPKNFGAFECGVIVRDHSNPIATKLMTNWYDGYMRLSTCKRDQLVFPYILWKMGFKRSDVGYIRNGITISENDDFEANLSSHDFKRICINNL